MFLTAKRFVLHYKFVAHKHSRRNIYLRNFSLDTGQYSRTLLFDKHYGNLKSTKLAQSVYQILFTSIHFNFFKGYPDRILSHQGFTMSRSEHTEVLKG